MRGGGGEGGGGGGGEGGEEKRKKSSLLPFLFTFFSACSRLRRGREKYSTSHLLARPGGGEPYPPNSPLLRVGEMKRGRRGGKSSSPLLSPVDLL